MDHFFGPTAWRLLVGWCVASLIGLVIALAGLAIDRSGTAEAGAANLESLWPFWIVSGALWLGLTGMWVLLQRSKAEHWGGFTRTAIFIGLIAVVARVAVVIGHEPALSDDVYRYVFDGRNLAAGLNPYLVKPGDRIGAAAQNWAGESEVVEMMAPRLADPDGAFAHLTTPYMPLSQYVFGAMGMILRAVPGAEYVSPLDAALLFRLGFVAIEMALILLLFAAVKRAGRSAWWVALYAWHPLPIVEIAGSGHQDVVGIVLLVAALVVFTAAKQNVAKSTALLALSAAVKPVGGPVAAFLLKGRNWKDWVGCAIVAALIVLAVALPLRWMPLIGSEAWTNWRETASEMSLKSAHFGGVYEPVLMMVRKVMPPTRPEYADGWNLVQETAARRFCVVILSVVFLFIFIRARDVWRAGSGFLLALALLSPVAHPWYLLWALALGPMAMSATLWVYSLTIMLGYVVFVSGKGHAFGVEWTVNPWVLLVAYGSVCAAAVGEFVIHFRRAQGGAKPPATADLRQAATI